MQLLLAHRGLWRCPISQCPLSQQRNEDWPPLVGTGTWTTRSTAVVWQAPSSVVFDAWALVLVTRLPPLSSLTGVSIPQAMATRQSYEAKRGISSCRWRGWDWGFEPVILLSYRAWLRCAGLDNSSHRSTSAMPRLPSTWH